LDKVLQKYPEIASVIATWPELPEQVKETIKALIKANKTDQKTNQASEGT